jgi:hypothetical protein
MDSSVANKGVCRDELARLSASVAEVRARLQDGLVGRAPAAG